MDNQLITKRKSNLVMPTHYIELDEEEMAYVSGGISLSSEGLYLSYDDIIGFTAVAAMNVYGLAMVMSVATSWICSTGVGIAIWGIFSVSSLTIAAYALSAASQRKGLMISINYVKIWFFSIPCGFNLEVK